VRGGTIGDAIGAAIGQPAAFRLLLVK